MLLTNKGIYPVWVNKKDIINQVLRELTREGGRLPYTYVINPDHEPEIRNRMKLVLDQMIKEKLILHPAGNDDFIEIDLEGSRAVHFGYRKYRRIKKWDTVLNKLSRVYVILFVLVLMALGGGLIYLILHYFKVF